METLNSDFICIYYTSTDFSLYKSELLKLAKSLGNDYHPEKGVIAENSLSANQPRCIYCDVTSLSLA